MIEQYLKELELILADWGWLTDEERAQVQAYLRDREKGAI